MNDDNCIVNFVVCKTLSLLLFELFKGGRGVFALGMLKIKFGVVLYRED